MIIRPVSVGSPAAAQDYIERRTDHNGQPRSKIVLFGSHTRSEFDRLLEIVDASGKAIEHDIFAFGPPTKLYRPATQSLANTVRGHYRKLCFPGRPITPPERNAVHYELGGGMHIHSLTMLYDFLSKRQISIFPRHSDKWVVRLFQTWVNSRFGQPDPYDPAFQRQFVPLQHGLSETKLETAVRAREALRNALADQHVRNNVDARNYLADHLSITSEVRGGNGLYLVFSDGALQLTTTTFAKLQTAPISPGGFRPWFTVEDRDLLNLAIGMRETRHRIDFPYLGYEHHALVGPQMLNNKRQNDNNQKTTKPEQNNSIAELSQDFADCDGIAREIFDGKPDSRRVRLARELFERNEKILGGELYEWGDRARRIHFGIAGPTLRIDRAVPRIRNNSSDLNPAPAKRIEGPIGDPQRDSSGNTGPRRPVSRRDQVIGPDENLAL